MLDIIHGRRFPLIVRKLHFSVNFHFCDSQRAAKVDFVTILLVMMLIMVLCISTGDSPVVLVILVVVVDPPNGGNQP